MSGIRFTLGLKVAGAFAVVVAMLLLVATTGFTQTGRLVAGQNELIERDFPVESIAEQLRGRIHAALSAHRGYIILGLEELKDERASIWEEIDGLVHELDVLLEESENAEGLQQSAELQVVLSEFQSSQAKIIALAHEPENLKANVLFADQAAPFGVTMRKHLERIIELERAQPATAERRDLVALTAGAEIHLLKVTATITDYLIDGDEAKLEQFRGELAACSESVARLTDQAGLFTAEQRGEFDAYIAARESFIAGATQVIDQRAADDWNQAQYICAGEVTPLAIEADRRIGALLEQLHGRLLDHEAKLMTVGSFTRTSVLVASTVALALAVGVAWLLSRAIVPPIRRVADAARCVAEGDLTTRVPAKANDECGDLAKSFNSMSDRVSDMIGEVMSTSRDVAAAATEIAASSEEIAGGMSEQSDQVNQISSAV
ncbi:MAG: methyl-accepting chemotaxis protein, partial [Pseudomonadota bacterium]